MLIVIISAFLIPPPPASGEDWWGQKRGLSHGYSQAVYSGGQPKGRIHLVQGRLGGERLFGLNCR